MSKHFVLAFDLSSACVGIVGAGFDEHKLPIIVKSMPLIPPRFLPSNLGYQPSKKKLPIKTGKLVNTYWRKGEISITEQEKKKRDVEVRNAKNLSDLSYISKNMSEIIKKINPDIILVEKNEIFNGVLTSVLLAKVMGTLIGIASANNIKVMELKVKKVRSIIDLTKATQALVESLSPEEISNVPDMTKRALRKLMEEKYGAYGLKCLTDDESDACVVMNYYYEEIFKKDVK